MTASIDLDDALPPTKYAQDSRWDYGLGYRTEVDRQILGAV